MVSIGEFGDMEWEDGEDDWKLAPDTMVVFFLLATVIVVIVMLNILIALVSSAY